MILKLSGVVVAVSAKMLTSFGTMLRSSPSWEKAFRKSSPLHKIIKLYVTEHVYYGQHGTNLSVLIIKAS